MGHSERKLSDRDYIEALRKREGRRRLRSAGVVALGFAVLGLAWFATSTTFRHVIFSELLPIQTANCADLILTVEKMSYWWGIAVGFSTALAWLFAAYFIGAGLRDIVSGRTERLLLELYDRTAHKSDTE